MYQSFDLRVGPDNERDGEYRDGPCKIPLAVKIFSLQGDIDVGGNREICTRQPRGYWFDHAT